MKSLFIVGNWKSNKTVSEAKKWLQEIYDLRFTIQEEYKVILCVSFTLLAFMKEEIARLSLPIALGAQDVSPFPDGSYTGAVSARMVKECVDWVIIGHSERRTHFGETDAMLAQKVHEAKDAGLSVIYCVTDETVVVPETVDMVAYEPPSAIGTGKPADPHDADRIIKAIQTKTGVSPVLYGGSVTEESISAFVSQDTISGVLVGKASLDPKSFVALIHASHLQ